MTMFRIGDVDYKLVRDLEPGDKVRGMPQPITHAESSGIPHSLPVHTVYFAGAGRYVWLSDSAVPIEPREWRRTIVETTGVV